LKLSWFLRLEILTDSFFDYEDSSLPAMTNKFDCESYPLQKIYDFDDSDIEISYGVDQKSKVQINVGNTAYFESRP